MNELFVVQRWSSADN